MQEGPPVTVALALPPRAGKVIVLAESVSVQICPGWVTVTVCSLMTILPVREAAPTFGSTVNASVASRSPEAGEVICIQGMLALALHRQFARIGTVPVPPAAGKLAERVSMLTLQLAGAC